MKPGSYDILARKEGMLSDSVSIEVPSEDADFGTIIALRSSETGTLESIALRVSDGEPIPQAWCRVYTSEGINIAPNNSRRDNRGALLVKDLPVGFYRTQVSHWGHSEAYRDIEIKAGETTTIEDVIYEAGSFRWIIHDLDGAPIAGASCTITPRDPNSIETVRTGVTDHQGYYDQRGLHPGEYMIRAEYGDKRFVEQPFDIQAHEHTERTTSTEKSYTYSYSDLWRDPAPLQAKNSEQIKIESYQ